MGKIGKSSIENMANRDTPSITWPVLRIRKDQNEQIEDPVPFEEPLEIIINGRSIAVLMRLPGQEKELVAGFCISEGYVRKPEDILLIHHCGLGLPAPSEEEADDERTSRNRVEVRVVKGGFFPPQKSQAVRLIRSGCGAADLSAMDETLPTIPGGFSVNCSKMLGFRKQVRTHQSVYELVGGTHSAAIFDASGQMATLSEDIGRHNALDKAAGSCLLRKIPLNDKILVTSGRASYEMVTKAIRLLIPVVASFSAPTSLAIELALNHGLTLAGYLRAGRMNVYTHAHRLTSEQ